MDIILERIKFLLKENNLTIFRLTELAKLSENTIYNWYNKGAEPSIRALKAICPHLKVSLAQLVAENDKDEMTYQENELIAVFRQLSDGQKEVLINFIKEFTEKQT